MIGFKIDNVSTTDYSVGFGTTSYMGGIAHIAYN
jgi:hypothetical protein